MRLGGGLALALLSAVALNWGYVAQHEHASAAPPLSLRRPLGSLRSLLASPRWLAGFAVGLGGWALYVAALALAPLSLVQAVSAGGIGVLALLVVRAGDSLAPREWAGVGAAVAGLALLAASLAGGHDHGHDAGWGALGAWLACSLAVAGAAAATRSAAGLGAAAGVLYAAGDVATKSAVGGGEALVPVVLAAHGLAFVCLQLGFQRGSVLTTVGLATLLGNALPIAAGEALFRESLPGGAAGAARVAAFVAVVAGAAVLSRRTVRSTDESIDTGARPACRPHRSPSPAASRSR